MWLSKHPVHAIAVAMLGAAVALVAVAAAREPASFLDLRGQRPVTGDARAGQALSKSCSACHGERGLAVAPMFPDLAGQSATYLYVQLKTFQGGQRKDPVMGPLAAPLGDADMRDLAAWYASLPASPGARPAPATPGGRLFSDGDPSRGIPPCQGCHGPGGQGPRRQADVDAAAPLPIWSTIPRLQGQSGVYVAKALHEFRSGARGGTSNAAIMHGVARTLSDADIQSLADFVDGQFVPSRSDR